MHNRLAGSESRTNRLDELLLCSSEGAVSEHARPQCRHILVPVTASNPDRQSSLLALRLGGLLRARVTFLQVSPPPAQGSLHWLDAIDHLHEGLSSRNRCSATPERDEFLLATQRKMIEWTKQELPEALRNQVEICVEARIGELAPVTVRYIDERSVDLLILHRVRSRWGWPALPRPARRLLKLTSTPAILVSPSPRQPGRRPETQRAS